MIRKIACILLCLMLIAPSGVLADTAPRKLAESETLYTSLRERSMELAGIFNEALHSEGYLALYTENGFEETLKLLRMQDFANPLDVTVVRADQALQEAWPDALAKAASEADLSTALADFVWQKAYHSAGNFLNAREGTQTLALSSILTFSDAYIRPEEMDGPCFALAQYGGLYAFLVTFCPTVNGTVTAQARFIPSRAADSLNLPIE